MPSILSSGRLLPPPHGRARISSGSARFWARVNSDFWYAGKSRPMNSSFWIFSPLNPRAAAMEWSVRSSIVFCEKRTEPVYLEVRESNVAARELYRSAGFKEIVLLRGLLHGAGRNRYCHEILFMIMSWVDGPIPLSRRHFNMNEVKRTHLVLLLCTGRPARQLHSRRHAIEWNGTRQKR